MPWYRLITLCRFQVYISLPYHLSIHWLVCPLPSQVCFLTYKYKPQSLAIHFQNERWVWLKHALEMWMVGVCFLLSETQKTPIVSVKCLLPTRAWSQKQEVPGQNTSLEKWQGSSHFSYFHLCGLVGRPALPGAAEMNQTFSYGLLKMGKVLEMIKSNPFFGKETEPESSGLDM